MISKPAGGRILVVLAFFSVLIAAATAHAQERWNAGLMICGTAGDGVWQGTGDLCQGIVPAGLTGLLYPNDFAEIVDPITNAHHLVVADTGNGRVLRFLDTGSAVTYVDELAPGSFQSPYGVVGDADGNILVADLDGSVRLFDWLGRVIVEPLTACTGDPKPFNNPVRLTLTPGTRVTPGATVNPTGRVLIVDSGNNRVVICDEQMHYLASFGNVPGANGADPGAFTAPTAVAVDRTGHIYVADPNNLRVQVFDQNASLSLGSLPSWIVSNQVPGTSRTSVPDMAYPFGVAIDANGRLLVADAGVNKMWVFDTFANLLRPLNVSIGTANSANQDSVPPLPPGPPGEMLVPANISLDASGRLMVADAYNMRVQRFSHPALTVTVTPPSQALHLGQPLQLRVAVLAASGTFTSVQLGFSAISSTGALTNLGTPTIVADTTDTVTAGLGPTNFTMTFNTTGTGTVAFSVSASGIPEVGSPRAFAPDGAGLTEPIPIGVQGDFPTTAATIVSAAGPVLVGSGPSAVPWYTTPPIVRLVATGHPSPPLEIHYRISVEQPPVRTRDFKTCTQAQLGLGTCEVSVTADGLSHVWYRAASRSTDIPPVALVAPWQGVLVRYDANPPLVIGSTTAPPTKNGWNNSSFIVTFDLLKGSVGWPTDRNGTSLVANSGTIPVNVPAHPDSAGFFLTVPEFKDAAGRSTQEAGPVQLGPYKLDSMAPTVSNPTIVGPDNISANALGVFDLTGKPIDVGVTVSVTASDPLPSSGMQVYYLPGGSNAACLTDPIPPCMAAAPGLTAGDFTTTFLNNVTNATIWALDGAANASAVRTFSVKITRGTPVANSASLSTLENKAVSGLLTATPAPGTTPMLTYAIAARAAHGTVVLVNSATGAFTYTPTTSYNGADSFGFTVSDGSGISPTAVVDIAIDAVNDAPLAIDGELTARPGTAVAGTLIARDIDSPSLTYGVVVNGTRGTATITNRATGAYTYTANTNATGSDSFTFRANDGALDSNVATVRVTIKPANANPACNAAFADPKLLWPPNHKFVAVGIKGVTDPDGDALTLAVNKIWQDESTMADGSGDTPIDGSIVNGVAQVRAERAGGRDGRIYQIFFTATDTKGNFCTGSVTVGVPHDQSGQGAIDSGVRFDSLVAGGPAVAGTLPNHAPVANLDIATTLKGLATAIAVLANDADPDGNTLTVTAVTAPSHGTASINANGTITYTPAAGYGGLDGFTYMVSDGLGGTATGIVTITIRSHTDGDGCEHDRHRKGGHDNDGSDHDKDTRKRGDDRH